MLEITKGIFSVGVLNPNLRVFDVIMKTDYGTSYNSYLVKGSEKTALIETAHRDFWQYYLDNVGEIADISTIDYVVMNHNEPDHSGCIARLVELNPNITVIASQAGAIYLKNIVNNPQLKVQVAKDGDSISLGDKTLQFINAPFLHWPDSMFTWVPEDKLLFSCDFLGCHYCEPQMKDTRVTYEDKYWDAFAYYYAAIFGPFKPYVIKGLDKIKDLELEFVCTSHGPVLTKEGVIAEAMKLYRQWSTPDPRSQKQIPIFYCTAYGNTKALACAVGEGIRQVLPDAAVELLDIIDHDIDELGQRLNGSDAFLVGTPTINKDAVPPVWQLLSHVDAVNIAKRPVAVFGSFGWSGEGTPNVAARLASLKTNVFEEPLKVAFVPTEKDLETAREFGVRFAQSLA
ncbi:FprA family A-type flavoprotein [Oscillospiraceae bacterium MB08-C2-2]|nr:FprA family A-type flavoprotein [Oscillospiraceae bacterium MB08-C2-2]